VRFSADVEAAVRATLAANNDACITFPEEAYGGRPVPLINRRHGSVLIHRFLYREIIGPLSPKQFLLGPTCGTEGCVSPFHRTVSKRANDPDFCRNGHRYTPENTLPKKGHDRCRTCRDQRNERRDRHGEPTQADINRAKTHCPHNHEYTPDNVYMTNKGQRKCKTCTLKRVATRRDRMKQLIQEAVPDD
jgi:hypothetical protein